MDSILGGDYWSSDPDELEKELQAKAAAQAPPPPAVGPTGNWYDKAFANPGPSPVAQSIGQQFAQPFSPVNPDTGGVNAPYGPLDTTTGQNYIDAPTGSLRAQLEAQRQGDSQYGPAAMALATALPIIASGPVAGPLGVIGNEAGNWADEQLNLPQIPILGGPLGILGGAIGGGADPGAIARVGGSALENIPVQGARELASNIARAGMPEPMLNPGLSGGPSSYNYEQWLKNASEPAKVPFDANYWIPPEARAPEFAAPEPLPHEVPNAPDMPLMDIQRQPSATGYSPQQPTELYPPDMPLGEPPVAGNPALANDVPLSREQVQQAIPELAPRAPTVEELAFGDSGLTGESTGMESAGSRFDQSLSLDPDTAGEMARQSLGPNATPAELLWAETEARARANGVDPRQQIFANNPQFSSAEPWPGANQGANEPVKEWPGQTPLSPELAGGGLTPFSVPAEIAPVSPPPSSFTPEIPTTATVATQTSNVTPFETAHQGLNNIIQAPTAPPTEIAQLRDEVRQLRETMQANGGQPPRWAEPPPPAGGSRPKGTGGGTPKGQGLIGQIRDALYVPFGFDWSSWLRQDAMRTMNPFRLAETFQVFKDSSRAIGSQDFAKEFQAGFKDRATALGVPNLHFPDWQGTDIVGRENLYSKLLNNLPGYEALNRGFSTEIASRRINALESFAKNHPGADLQHEANRLERVTGRGSFGSGALEQGLSKAGPAFTALRYTLSIPERTASLIPFQRLTDGSFQMFGPSWRESVIDHAGFVTTVAAAMAAAQQAGLKVGWDPSNQTSGTDGKVPFGSIQLPNGTFVNLTGGASKYVNAVMQLATGEKNGKDFPLLAEKYRDFKGNETYRGTVAEFLRNLTGPVLQVGAAGLKEAGVNGRGLEFMRPDLWDKGVTGKGTTADRAAQFVVPLWIQDVADAVRNSAKGDQLPSQIGAGAAAFFGAGVQTYDRQPLSDARDQVKNDPALPEAIRGLDYKDLGPDGKAAVDKLAEQKAPEDYKQGKEDQVKNSDPAFQKYHDTTTKINDEEAQRKNDLYEALRTGKLNGADVREAKTIIESAANAKRDAARNDPEYKKSISELEQNKVNNALNVFYAIPDKYRGADGKIDYDAAKAKQFEFLQAMEKRDPGTMKPLMYEINTSKAPTNTLDEIYKMAQPLLQQYFGDIKDPYARAQAQFNNPKDDAFLALLGYGKTQSPQAAQLLQQMRSTLPAAAAPVAVGAPVRSAAPAPEPAPPPQAMAAPMTATPRGGIPAPTGAVLPPLAPGEMNSPTASQQQRSNFINAMAAPANAWSQATGIPPAVYAAMGASESNWGRAPSVFGIKGTAPSGGSSNLATHEVYGGQNVNINDQFAAYKGLDEAFQHFNDLTSNGRYAPAREYLQQTGDWYGFLRQITDAGYATAKNWPESIRDIATGIERDYPQLRR